MKYLFGFHNRLITSEESYSICNLKPIRNSVYYSDDENVPELEEDYAPKWKRLNLNSDLNSHIHTYIHSHREILKRTVDFEMPTKVFICTLKEFEECLLQSLMEIVQPEAQEVAQLDIEINKLKASRPYLFSFLYSLTYYNQNLNTSIANAEHRKNFIFATLKVRYEKDRDELKSVICHLYKEAKKYSASHIIFHF